MRVLVVGIAVSILAIPTTAVSKVVRLEVQKRESWLDGRTFGSAGAYELVSGIAYYEIDPRSEDARGISDIELAPRNRQGRVEYSGPFLILRPRDPAKANGATLLEIANRGGTQANGSFFVADQFDLPDPHATRLDDQTAFNLGYTMVWVAWQAKLPNSNFTLKVPTGTGRGRVRFTFVAEGPQVGATSTTLESNEGGYCSRSFDHRGAALRIKSKFNETGVLVPKSAWHFARSQNGKSIPDVCFLTVDAGFQAQRLYELTYQGESAPVVGLGFAAVRDFASALRSGAFDPLRASDAKIMLAYGYSQSGRFLRDYLYRGFNKRSDGGLAFDGMLISAAGAGRGSFDHRYAMPGEAGNSVMSALRPVDLYPFADVPTPDINGHKIQGLLDRERVTGTVPKIMYIFSSSEYWARAGSLLTTTTDGKHEVPLAPESRLYVFTGSVHAPERPNNYLKEGSRAAYPLNPTGDQFWAQPALLEDMRQWIVDKTAPPASVYPHVGVDLVPAANLGFPALKGVTAPNEPPPVWQLDFGPYYATRGVVTRDPPKLGERYMLLVPRVDADGNELGGWRGILASVPLGTLTAWNWPSPGYRSFGVLSQLGGAYLSFATDPQTRKVNGDPRPSLAERYGDKAGYLRAVDQALDRQIAARMLLPSQRADALSEATRAWDGTIKLNEASASH